MTQWEFGEIMRLHDRWRHGNSDGKRAILFGCNLSGLDLSGLDLSDCGLINCSMSGCDLSGSDLRDCDLRGCDLSGSFGLVSPIDYMDNMFERTPEGYVAYKTFNKFFNAPTYWIIEPGSIISETVNMCRTDACGCGINVGTLDWVKRGSVGKIWKVLIRWEWLPGVCVPYNTDGKIRCERVQLLEIVRR